MSREHSSLCRANLNDLRLYHQLTEELFNLLKDPLFADPSILDSLYSEIIQPVGQFINHLAFAKFTGVVARSKVDLTEAEALLRKTEESFTKDSQKEAQLFVKTELAHILLLKNEGKAAFEGLEVVREGLEQSAGMDNSVWSQFYQCRMEYFAAINDPSAYYTNGMLYVGFLPENSVLEETVSVSLAWAALTAPNVFNSGELLLLPAFSVVRESANYAWLMSLMEALHQGNPGALSHVPPRIATPPNAAGTFRFAPSLEKLDMTQLQMKLHICTLLDLLLRRHQNVGQSRSTILTLQFVADRCQLALLETELLIIRALSLGLIRGRINQVNGTVDVTWVKPRVLQLEQLWELKGQLLQWQQSVHNLSEKIEGQNMELAV